MPFEMLMRLMTTTVAVSWVMPDPFAVEEQGQYPSMADCNHNGRPDEAELGDINGDGWIDLLDYAGLQGCVAGPYGIPPCDPPPDVGTCCHLVDLDIDCDVDLADFAGSQRVFMECASDLGCDDGFFCNGPERCVVGLCLSSGNPCTPCEICDEENDGCLPVTSSECGNGVVEPCEECDDGNNEGGDGCDANCRLEPLANDDCASPMPVADGTTDFTNRGATTHGPDEPEVCSFAGDSHVESDIWFCHEATCTGELVLSLCGSDYDTKIAVYQGSAAASTATLGAA